MTVSVKLGHPTPSSLLEVQPASWAIPLDTWWPQPV